MRRSVRVAAILHELRENPNKKFKLSYFGDKYQAAKSTISEDLIIVNEAVQTAQNGYIKTLAGADGGVQYKPWISDEQILKIQEEFCKRLNDSDRILGGGFLYTSDIMFDTHFIKDLARIFVRRFSNIQADYIATIETKGIPLAAGVAFFMGLPLVVIRREPKFSEGSTISINYFSGPDERVQKMSIARRSVKEGSRAIVIDDFMRGGGSVKGIAEILEEFNISVVATGIAIVASSPEHKKIHDYTAILNLEKVDEINKTVLAVPNVYID